jgi:alcohol dehydrogenase
VSVSSFDFLPRTRVVFGEGVLERLGEAVGELGLRRVLLVADRGLAATEHVDRARTLVGGGGAAIEAFHEFDVNPDSVMVARGADVARAYGPDGILALGGGSSLDCAKGINFLATNGGEMRDYRGYGKTTAPLLPMVAVPTTAGTGSEAQSYAVIADAETRMKMACGDPGAAFRLVLLDPELTLTSPAATTAAAGIDAIGHAVEAWVTTRRNPLSDMLAREAFRLLSVNYLRVLSHPHDRVARAAMLLGAHWAGAAIEQSMLGAAHACANPLTARYGTVHGVAIALLLPSVVRWNIARMADRYAELAESAGLSRRPEALAGHLEQLVAGGGFPDGLGSAGIAEGDLPALAVEAAQQWTGRFNPRPFDEAGALEIYTSAY